MEILHFVQDDRWGVQDDKWMVQGDKGAFRTREGVECLILMKGSVNRYIVLFFMFLLFLKVVKE
jgi:hypothetical protein